MVTMSKTVVIRNVADELVAAVDEFAKANAGEGGKPSREAALRTLIARGLAAPVAGGAVVRGDTGRGVRREA